MYTRVTITMLAYNDSNNYPPLSLRVIRCDTESHRTPYIPLQRPKYYKGYSSETFDLAVNAVVEGGLSIRRAAEEYAVPKSTLGDHVQGRVLAGAVGGRQRYLSASEEKMLVDFILRSAEIGYPHGRKEIICMVQNVCDHKGLQVTVSHGWWERFCQRNKGFSLRVPSSLSTARHQGTNKRVMEAYFDMLEETLEENNLTDKPCQIFNMDETGLPLSPKPPKLLCKTGSRAFNAVTGGDKSQITVVGCVSAGGYQVPPMVIYDRKTLHADMVKGEVGGTLYGLSQKGWIDQELFRLWFKYHFLRYIPPERPVILLMDGHSTHYCPETMVLAAKERVVVFALPPNTTHVSQPLDKGCFGPLKAAWKSVCHEYCVKNPGRAVTRYTFSELFSQAWMQSMNMRNIISGFRCTGIYPVDRSKLMPQDEANASLCGENRVYVPFLSPSRRKTAVQQCATSFDLDEIDSFLKEQRIPLQASNSKDMRHERREKFQEMYLPRSIVSSSTPSLDYPYAHTPVSSDKHGGLVGGLAVAVCKPVSVLERVLKMPETPTHVSAQTSEKELKTSRVLTSTENLQLLQEKARKKEEKQKKKEINQQKREQKRQPSLRSKTIVFLHLC